MSRGRSSLLEPPRAREGTSFAEFFAQVRTQPIYVILGVQGSGTNLLSRILTKGFRFSVIQDGSVTFKAAAALGATPSPREVRRQYELLRSRLLPSALVRKTRRLVKSKASFEGIDECFDPASIRSGADLARFVYAYAAFALGTRLMAIKSDDLWEDIHRIDEVLPERRIILLTRDFRDDLLSVSKKDFGPIEPLVAAEYVKERFAHYEQEYRRTAPEHRYHVRYEDLLESPVAFMHELGAHFGLQPAPDGATAVQGQRIKRGNVRKWLALAPEQLAHVEAMLDAELRRYGYEPTTDHSPLPGAATLMKARVKDAIKRVPQKAGRLVKRLRNQPRGAAP
jgi:hypothetical protein